MAAGGLVGSVGAESGASAAALTQQVRPAYYTLTLSPVHLCEHLIPLVLGTEARELSSLVLLSAVSALGRRPGLVECILELLRSYPRGAGMHAVFTAFNMPLSLFLSSSSLLS